ncbi:uncharacterized protein LOC116565380 [Sapajus apella]|uniref:Uncharacterized protein LOC116565380 n=1 Tax=Sapajus apella TaxID=9515 RepID=A0A6J3JKB5_SAPAP|nr:uncharacterized protein LOC116565380 [Sapajus apella]
MWRGDQPSASPPPTLTSEAETPEGPGGTDPRPPCPGPGRGLPAPQSPSPRQCEPAAKPAGETAPPRPSSDDCRGARGSVTGGAALAAAGCSSPAAPAASGRRSRGRRKPEEGGAGTIPSPRIRRGSTGGCGKLLRLRGWRQLRGGRGRPRFAEEGAKRREAAGLAVPPGGNEGAQPSPYLSGGADSTARPRRAPGPENHRGGRDGERRRVASGQGRRIDFHRQEDTPIPPWSVCKAAGAGVRGGRALPFPAGLAGAEANPDARRSANCDTKPSRRGGVCRERLNSGALPSKGKCKHLSHSRNLRALSSVVTCDQMTPERRPTDLDAIQSWQCVMK